MNFGVDKCAIIHIKKDRICEGSNYGISNEKLINQEFKLLSRYKHFGRIKVIPYSEDNSMWKQKKNTAINSNS